MNSKKTFPTVALIAILMVSIAPSSAFALTADEEISEGQSNDFNPNAQSGRDRLPGSAARHFRQLA